MKAMVFWHRAAAVFAAIAARASAIVSSAFEQITDMITAPIVTPLESLCRFTPTAPRSIFETRRAGLG